jgi:thioester reductase-like protein
LLCIKKGADKDAKFYYISTSYAAGRDIHIIPESRIELDEDMSFHNEYEHSKVKAENLVINHISKGEISGNIFRTSVVVGDKQHGRLINYHGFYLSRQTLFNFKRCLAQNGELLEELTFETNGSKTIILPIFVKILNLRK